MRSTPGTDSHLTERPGDVARVPVKVAVAVTVGIIVVTDGEPVRGIQPVGHSGKVGRHRRQCGTDVTVPLLPVTIAPDLSALTGH